MNFVGNETLKIWISWKMRLWKCEFCGKWDFENVNFVKNEIFEMGFFVTNGNFENVDFCQKWDFGNVNFINNWNFRNVNLPKNESLKMWILSKVEIFKMWICQRMRFSACEFCFFLQFQWNMRGSFAQNYVFLFIPSEIPVVLFLKIQVVQEI